MKGRTCQDKGKGEQAIEARTWATRSCWHIGKEVVRSRCSQGQVYGRRQDIKFKILVRVLERRGWSITLEVAGSHGGLWVDISDMKLYITTCTVKCYYILCVTNWSSWWAYAICDPLALSTWLIQDVFLVHIDHDDTMQQPMFLDCSRAWVYLVKASLIPGSCSAHPQT